MQTEQTRRTGRITLMHRVDGRAQYATYPVREEEDGSLSYYLGAAARTSDGWVVLDDQHRDRVVWES